MALMKPMEALNAETIRRHCQIFEFEVHDQLESTQIRARQRIADGLLRPAAVIAQSQSAGRGQQGRSWFSPPGGAIYLTTIWPTTRPPSQLGGLSLAVGLAIRRMLAHWQVEAQLKWPNDIWLDQRKLAGVLTEIVSAALGSSLLIGIGLNLRLPESASAEIDQPWTELSHWLHPLPSRNQLIGRLLHELQQVLETFELAGFAAFSDEWRRADALRGRQVWLRNGNSAEQGHALGIDELGRLRIDVDGVIRAVSAGEVSIRPL